MSLGRRLILVLTAATLLVGTLAVLDPVTAAQDFGRGRCTPPCDAPCCDPDCRHNCPLTKKVKGVGRCSFSGCFDDGACTYTTNCIPE